MGRKRFCDSGEMTSTRVPQNKCVSATKFFGDKLPTWANNGNCVEDIQKNFRAIVSEGIKCFVPHKILKRNPDPEYYNNEVK